MIAETSVRYPPFNSAVLVLTAGLGAFVTIIALVCWPLQRKNDSDRPIANALEYLLMLSSAVLVFTAILTILLYVFEIGSVYPALAFLGLTVAPILLIVNIIILIYLTIAD